MKLFGIEFAPLNVTWERRLQTLSTLVWLILLGLGSPISYLLTTYLLIFGNNVIRLLLLLYFGLIYLERDTCKRGGRSEKWTRWMRNWSCWGYFTEYFPARMIKTADLDPKENYLFCSYPHGVLATGVFCAFATEKLGFKSAFPGLKPSVITLEQNFNIPFLRESVHSFGLCSASVESLNYLLSTKPEEEAYTGRAVVLVVGGAAESLNCRPRNYEITLKNRKGFIRLALTHGTSLVPVFSFGETEIYSQVSNPKGSKLRRFQEWFKNLTGVSPVLVLGRGMFQYSFGLLPRRRPINVVVGKPIKVPRIAEPTKSDVNEYHKKFMDELLNLFERDKHKYLENADEITLIID